MDHNIISAFLKLIDVRYTRSYTGKFFNEHPHKYNLFGLSDMLSSYGVESMGVHFKDKTEILSVDVPFIAHTGSDFVIVEEVSGNEIRFIERNKKIKDVEWICPACRKQQVINRARLQYPFTQGTLSFM